ncbi:hypothetical protein ACQ4LE_004180 [Meloidogyne hapla]|uniref:DUF2953 domain-containing protein n=1 Tax=Meloidogyne hapla TaxID=6305 RepID=A0A1I8BKR4_MELHA
MSTQDYADIMALIQQIIQNQNLMIAQLKVLINQQQDLLIVNNGLDITDKYQTQLSNQQFKTRISNFNKKSEKVSKSDNWLRNTDEWMQVMCLITILSALLEFAGLPSILAKMIV